MKCFRFWRKRCASWQTSSTPILILSLAAATLGAGCLYRPEIHLHLWDHTTEQRQPWINQQTLQAPTSQPVSMPANSASDALEGWLTHELGRLD